ncbi:Diphthamide biosynthesis protein 3 [Terramyces sp. JEL0728]|nr:Diphthamide biosynthesis protein 3 [Terramyces sp. JEL0728]
MTSFYDEIEIEDFEYNEEEEIFYFPCPCGDKFQISRQDLADEIDVATCPSCSLIIRVIYDVDEFREDGETVDFDQEAVAV